MNDYLLEYCVCDECCCICCLVPSDVPTSFSANAISPNIINTTWEPPTAYHLGGVITSYTLTYTGRERHSSLKKKILIVLNGSIYITPSLTDLQENTHYLISVRANTSVGAGPWTDLTVLTPEDGEFVFLCILHFSAKIERFITLRIDNLFVVQTATLHCYSSELYFVKEYNKFIV